MPIRLQSFRTEKCLADPYEKCFSGQTILNLEALLPTAVMAGVSAAIKSPQSPDHFPTLEDFIVALIPQLEEAEVKRILAAAAQRRLS